MRQTLAEFYAPSPPPPQSLWSSGKQQQQQLSIRLPVIPAKSTANDVQSKYTTNNSGSSIAIVSNSKEHLHPELSTDNRSSNADTHSSGNSYHLRLPSPRHSLEIHPTVTSSRSLISASFGPPSSRRRQHRDPPERPQRNVTFCLPLTTSRPFQISSVSTDRCTFPVRHSANRTLRHAVFPDLEQSPKTFPTVQNPRTSSGKAASDGCLGGRVSAAEGLNPRVKRNLPALVALERSQSIYICNLHWRRAAAK